MWDITCVETRKKSVMYLLQKTYLWKTFFVNMVHHDNLIIKGDAWSAGTAEHRHKTDDYNNTECMRKGLDDQDNHVIPPKHAWIKSKHMLCDRRRCLEVRFTLYVFISTC